MHYGCSSGHGRKSLVSDDPSPPRCADTQIASGLFGRSLQWVERLPLRLCSVILRTPILFTALLTTTLALSARTFAQEAVAEAPPLAVPVDLEQNETEPTEAEPAAPRLSTESDWQEWERLGRSTLSPDGRWIAYSVSQNDGTSELRLRVVATDSTEAFEQGGSPAFSSDAKWLAYRIGKSTAETKKLRKAKKPIENQLGLFDLVQGKKEEVDGVQSFEFSSDGAFIAMRRYAPKGDENGTDLVIRELQTGVETHFGRVTSHAWSEAGAWIAITVSAPDKKGNGLRVFDAGAGILRTLDSDEAEYVGMTWRDDSADLAVMRKTTYEDDEDPTFAVLAWRDVSEQANEANVFDHLAADGFPEDLRVVEFDGLRWADDGAALYFGLKEWEERPAKLDEDEGLEEGDSADGTPEEQKPEEQKPEEDDSPASEAAGSLRETLDEAPGVEVWHAKDIRIIPNQKVTARRDERDTIAAVYWLAERRLVQLEDDLTEDVDILEGGLQGIGYDETPYEEEQRFSATLNDIYSVDVKTGDQERVLERVKYAFPGHPTGGYFLYVRDDHLWSFSFESGKSVNLTANVQSKFIDQESSVLTDEKRPYGIAGWTQDGDSVLLYDRFDIWQFPLAGGEPTQLTEGAEYEIEHRRVRVAADRDDDQFIDMDEGFYFSLYGERTKKSGFGHMKNGTPPTHLVWKDARVSALAMAEDAPVLSFREERFDDSPDLFVAGPMLDEPKQVSATNSHAEEFLWGHSELVDYESANGVPLQGALFYPADYDPSKTYPMVVYIYELRSQSLHQYATPSERNPYSPGVFTQNGYFVFQPDIVYRAQNPGLSAVECVVPAVRKVLEDGKVDPERVGLFGHSWGAYQTAFIVTQTDLFAAGVAGAPLTNMMSMSMSIYWNSGGTDAKIFHESQGRMDRPFWRDVDTYIANSPIFSIESLNTPLLVAFGDNDGAVDWQQGIEMYNAARLAQRPYVMLVYPGENHGLAEEANQVDYHHRVREWFSTHLDGEEAPEWISEGQPWLEQKKALDAIGKDQKKKGPK